MRRLIVRLFVNALALYIAVRFVPGISAEGGVGTFVLVALILGVANVLVRPLLTILSCPLLILTLGLFSLVINALILWLAGSVAAGLGLDFRVDGFVPAFWGGLVVALVNWVMSLLLGEYHDRR